MTMILTYLALLLTTLLSLLTASPIHTLTRDNVAKFDIDKELKVVQYLVRYGHLDVSKINDIRSARLSQATPVIRRVSTETKTHKLHPYTAGEIKNAVKSLQSSFGLEISGELTDETMKMIENPRCGVPDKETNAELKRNHYGMTARTRKKRYVIKHLRYNKWRTFKWTKKVITWDIAIYYSNLPRKTQDETLEKAFKQWEYASTLIFRRISSRNADIIIQFVSGAHGDSFSFDGEKGVLAHAFPPGLYSLAGDIHFDAAEKWNINFDLFSTALHEIGHSVGLAHSQYKSAIMYPTYNNALKTLQRDDRNGVEALYGRCQTKIDDAIYLYGDVYFLRGDKIWMVDEFDLRNAFSKGYPKLIRDEFVPGIPSNVDAALQWSDYHFYFIKGSRSWGFNQWTRTIRYDQTVAHDWPRIPNSPDAALCYTDDLITWFFKGNLCYKMYDHYLRVDASYPRKISDIWQGVPDDIDAAFYSQWYRETYFFKGTNYWVVDNKKYKKEPYKAYPGGPINRKWLGVCSEKY